MTWANFRNRDFQYKFATRNTDRRVKFNLFFWWRCKRMLVVEHAYIFKHVICRQCRRYIRASLDQSHWQGLFRYTLPAPAPCYWQKPFCAVCINHHANFSAWRRDSIEAYHAFSHFVWWRPKSLSLVYHMRSRNSTDCMLLPSFDTDIAKSHFFPVIIFCVTLSPPAIVRHAVCLTSTRSSVSFWPI